MTLKETIKLMKEKNSEEKFDALIESLKRRAEKGLLERTSIKDIDDILKSLNETSINKNSNLNFSQEIFELTEAINNFSFLEDDGEKEVLDESVTYIDNAGNLKTKSTEAYVKDQHLYNTKTQIEKYEKRKRKKDYKLISEEVDINNIKKLSEMSLEEILSEDF